MLRFTENEGWAGPVSLKMRGVSREAFTENEGCQLVADHTILPFEAM